MYKHENNIYLSHISENKYNIYNINNKIIIFSDKIKPYYDLNYFHINNKIYIFDCFDYNINVYDLNENKFIEYVFDKIQKYKYCIKLSENKCLFIHENNKHIFFDFDKNEFITINIHLNDLKLLYNIYNYYYDIKTNYYYIDNNHYIFENKLYFFSKRTISKFSNKNIKSNLDAQNQSIISQGNLITLKSSISNEQKSIPKNVLISRSEFFKDIFELYDINELVNENFENINIYYQYIVNNKIIDVGKLFDICLYLHDVDVEHITYYIIKYYDREHVYKYLNKLYDIDKYNLNKYLNFGFCPWSFS